MENDDLCFRRLNTKDTKYFEDSQYYQDFTNTVQSHQAPLAVSSRRRSSSIHKVGSNKLSQTKEKQKIYPKKTPRVVGYTAIHLIKRQCSTKPSVRDSHDPVRNQIATS